MTKWFGQCLRVCVHSKWFKSSFETKPIWKFRIETKEKNQEGVFGTGHCSMTLKSNRPHHHQYDILLRSWSFFRGEILYCLHRSLMHLLLAQIKLLLPFTPIWIIRTIDSTATLAFGDAASFFVIGKVDTLLTVREVQVFIDHLEENNEILLNSSLELTQPTDWFMSILDISLRCPMVFSFAYIVFCVGSVVNWYSL